MPRSGRSDSSTKGTLARRRRELALYERVLPSLELKRRQLLVERERENRLLQAQRQSADAGLTAAGERLPMLAVTDIPLDGMVLVDRIESRTTTILGTPVPRLVDVRWRRVAYGLLASPHWIDAAIDEIQKLARCHVEISFAEERVRRLDGAIRKLTQKVSLFEKLMIPAARADISRLRITLGDADRASVVRSKIFKARHRITTEQQP